jgi:hypothetical protein
MGQSFRNKTTEKTYRFSLNIAFCEDTSKEDSPFFRALRSTGRCLTFLTFCVDKVGVRTNCKFQKSFFKSIIDKPYLMCDEKQLKGYLLIIVECSIR